MKIRRGWSGETSVNEWSKLDVELETEDIEKILNENEISYKDISIRDLFLLVGVETEILVMADAASHGAKVVEKLAGLKDRKSDTISRIKQKIATLDEQPETDN